MAWTIEKAVQLTLDHLRKTGIELSDDKTSDFINLGYTNISGYNCRVANVLNDNNFRVRVSSEWFKGKNDAKPKIRTSSLGFDYQLLPTKKYLFAVYYLALRDYTLLLEEDRQKWFQEPMWGLELNIDTGLFTWKGGNTSRFPLLVFSSPLDLELRARQYNAQRNLVL